MNVSNKNHMSYLSGINKSILSKTIVGWILTLVVASLTTAILVSQVAYALETNGF